MLIGATILDMGRSVKYFHIAMLGHTLANVMIVLRRRFSPTKFDLFFIRFGVVFLLFVTACLAPFVWSVIGKSDLTGLERWSGQRFGRSLQPDPE